MATYICRPNTWQVCGEAKDVNRNTNKTKGQSEGYEVILSSGVQASSHRVIIVLRVGNLSPVTFSSLAYDLVD